MNKKVLIITLISAVLVFVIGVISVFAFYTSSLKATGSSDEIVEFKIESGSTTNEVLNKLKANGLIKNINTAKIYIKLNNISNIQAGDYTLNKGMSLKEILSEFKKGRILDDEVTITFIEGKRLTYYAKVISNNFGYTEKEILDTLNNKDFLNELIEDYWFITEDILKKDIYYPLEGYVFPDTYNFKKGSSIKDIIRILINELDKNLTPYKEQIENSGYTPHELLTLASIVELEGVNKDDRSQVASVFYNRIKDKWTLGSDVTTYYAVQKDFSVELTMDEYNKCNPYNTRSTCFTGLPIGPICGISKESLLAAIEPAQTDYYFFVADKNKKTYFAKTNSEFSSIINKLKKENLWYTY